VDILVNITVNIDYPDEDIEELTYEKLGEGLHQVCDRIGGLLDTADTGKILRDGLGVVIIGKPNVGKSSLMNALLKETRAIVTEIPGTTRDTIEEMVSIRNIPVKLTDTAGIRDTDDRIEKIGIERSKESFNRADLILFMVDGSRELDQEDEEIMKRLTGRQAIVLINKSDLPQKIKAEDFAKKVEGCKILQISLKKEAATKAVEDEIENLVYGGKVNQHERVMVTNVRHQRLLEEACQSIKDAIHMTELRQPLEFIEIDVNRGYQLLGEIIGETASDDIINEVFSRFCLGK
jgi:tRNA modification GTPase